MDVNGQINIIPQISGRVTKVHPNFNNGGTFNKGDILFQIEQADFINAVNIAKAQVEQARTALTLQQAESNAAIEEWRSLNPNRKAPDLVAKKPQLQQANANLKSAQAQLADAQLGLNRTKFNYNFSGRIIDTSIELGQFLQAGQSYGRAYPLNSLEIKVPVEDKVLKFLDVDANNAQNNKVTIRTKYRGENIVIDGTIDRIGSTLDETTRFVDVIVKPNDNQPNALIPGVFVEVDLIGKAVDNVWVLPNEALQGQSDIWIVNDDNTLRQYTPQIITTGDKTSDAIGNGETVKVVMGLLKGVTDGMSVRVANDTASDMPPPPKTDTTPSEPAE